MILWPSRALYLWGALITLSLLCAAEVFAFMIFYLKFDRIAGVRSFEDYKITFFEITCRREQYYWWAWILSAIGGGLFVVLIAAMIIFSALGR